MWLARRSGKKRQKKPQGKKGGKKNRGQKTADKKTREIKRGKKAREKKRGGKKKAQEKSVGNGAGRKPTDYIVSDLSFTSDWVKKWCEISKPIKMRRGSKGISYNFGYFRRLIEHCFNCD